MSNKYDILRYVILYLYLIYKKKMKVYINFFIFKIKIILYSNICYFKNI